MQPPATDAGRARKALLPALLLAICSGCASQPAATASPSASVVRAFAAICGKLQTEDVVQQAQAYGFVAFDPQRQPSPMPAALRNPGIRAWLRPSAGLRTLLIWNEPRRSCELGAGGIDIPEVEREFASMIAALERSGLDVTRLTVRDPSGGALGIRQAVIVAPRTLTPGQIRQIILRVNVDQTQAMQVAMAMQPFQQPPQRPSQEDDAVPY
ncbi:hypothetical protein [Siccirubricoccus sp. G192]|uniref:hypothetical protein n=1 Tax=Siccirubricoccus sp. G192 TaxID=2849651 RepID=UPI001C2CC254|nr:hypothetical protein [Siccirubricoccus sp. G192]MBV1797072.1 hypothetical protein [Siccirubricoccus sp. G192]